MADLLEPLSTSEYIIDEVLRYGLFFGAIFQAVCIAAAIWLPAKEDPEDESAASGQGGSKGGPTPPPRSKGAKHSGDSSSSNKKKRR
ncbi:protein MANBAL-like [Varroa jacobsoni]|uniref:Protein anon-73B1 n=1 Tax=Varroa destructor TaxID=109461 RepID=A0A7M7J4U7_VARDE|nr:protein MANBAL-like [Varroa destructor]XP_022687523.1 protein MANBAL-like [Varroa jacobsoni]